MIARLSHSGLVILDSGMNVELNVILAQHSQFDKVISNAEPNVEVKVLQLSTLRVNLKFELNGVPAQHSHTA